MIFDDILDSINIFLLEEGYSYEDYLLKLQLLLSLEDAKTDYQPMKEEDKGRKLKVGFGEAVEMIVRIAWTLSLVKEPQLDLDYLIADDDDDDSKSGL